MNGANEPVDGSKLPPAFITQFDYYSQTVRKEQNMNPEQLLDEVATAIKHRTISTTFKWNIVYYYDRITCVPTNVNVPPEIIFGEFDEETVQAGFTATQWALLKVGITKFYKELHK